MRRLLAPTALALCVLVALSASALASTPRPVVTSVSPSTVAVGQTLTLRGKNFAKGARIYFRRASDGKTVRARAKSATRTRITVVVPATVNQFLTVDATGAKQATRFQIGVFTKTFGPYTRKSRSPLILPAGATPGGGGTTGGGPTVAPPDCDGDGNPDATDTDDDNDGLPDDTEAKIGTDKCKADTDGDGVSDAYEYYSALDLNGNNLPYPGKRPYPNPLDGTDASRDFDGDGMTQAEEYAAWNASGAAFGNRALPAGPGQSFPYSDGNQTSPAANGDGVMDLNNNGRITDEERDADNDGLPNWVEMAKGEPTPSAPEGCNFAGNTDPEFTGQYGSIFTDCGAGRLPNGNTFVVPGTTVKGSATPPFVSTTSYLDADTDGDGVIDGNDDQDHDGLSNIEEITAGADTYFTHPQDPCDPNPESGACPTHPSHT